MSDSNSEFVVVPRKTARPPSPVGHTARHYLSLPQPQNGWPRQPPGADSEEKHGPV